MARITVEDCLTEQNNRFALVRLAAKRAKQLLSGSDPVTDTKGNRAVVSALREIANGKVRFSDEAEENDELSEYAIDSLKELGIQDEPPDFSARAAEGEATEGEPAKVEAAQANSAGGPVAPKAAGEPAAPTENAEAAAT